MNFNKPYLYIASNPEKVIEEIKKKDCILNEVIKPFPDIDFLKQFAISHYWSDSESVNVFRVVGTARPDYNCGITWIDMLKVGKRMHLNLSLLAENPDYYFENKKKEPEMHYTKINDEIYISGEGNHRTAIAKVLFYFTGDTLLHGIKYDEFEIDFNLLETYGKIKEILFRKYPHIEIQILRKSYKRDDTAKWKKDYYQISFLLINHRKGKSFEFNSNEAQLVLQELSSMNFISKFFSKSKLKNIL